MSQVIVVGAQDAGGTQTILPVLERLRERQIKMIPFAAGPAIEILRKSGFEPKPVDVTRNQVEVVEQIGNSHPRMIFCANSIGFSVEDVLIEIGRKRGLLSVGMLDSWLLYEKKFTGNNGPWTHLPDRLIVMDEIAKTEMERLGAPSERLIPLGQPQFDGLQERKTMFNNEKRKGIRERFRVGEKELLVLLLSQDMNDFYGGKAEATKEIGYTEFDVLTDVERAVKELSQQKQMKLSLIVKLHPREDAHKFDNTSIQVIKDADPFDLIFSSDLVIGMDTILLVQAGLMGQPTLSYQPHRKGVDSLVTNRIGLGTFCYEPSDLRKMIEDLLFNDPFREKSVAKMKSFPWSPGATERVTDYIFHQMSLA